MLKNNTFRMPSMSLKKAVFVLFFSMAATSAIGIKEYAPPTLTNGTDDPSSLELPKDFKEKFEK